MNIEVRAYTDDDIEAMVTIWNQVVEDGEAFPQEECLTQESGTAFFAEQTYCGVAEDMDTGRIYGMYILHPNNVGRCGHICNASYAVDRESRGLHIGEKLVSDCLAQGKAHGYRVSLLYYFLFLRKSGILICVSWRIGRNGCAGADCGASFGATGCAGAAADGARKVGAL